MRAVLILALIFNPLVLRAEVVVRHPDTDEASYFASIKPGSQTVVEHLDSQLPSSADEKRILQKFERAQTLFLSSDLEQAKVAYIEVAEEAFRADWSDTQRKAIQLAFLRVAQLSQDLQASQAYLVKAADYAPNLDFDQTLFPPPLFDQYKEILSREKSKSLQVDLKDKFPHHDLIIVDGKRVAAEEVRSFSVTPGPHRVTALSNTHQIFTQQLTSSQLNLIKADVPAYAIGTCAEPALSGYQSLASEQVRIVFPDKCMRLYTGTSWVSQTNLENTPSVLPSASFAQSSSAPKPILTNKKLLIIGLGVGALVAAAMLIKKSQQQRDETVPVNREGF